MGNILGTKNKGQTLQMRCDCGKTFYALRGSNCQMSGKCASCIGKAQMKTGKFWQGNG